MRAAERTVGVALRGLDSWANRAWGSRWNPLHQSGTISVAMLLVLTATGLYLILFYRVGSPSESVAKMAADPWLGSWIRSLHRYASDLFVIAAVFHMLRMFAQGRSWGPRTLAWISGVMLLGVGLLCAWTGFVMAWDSFGQRLAIDAARMLDVLPIFSEPLSRIFSGDRPMPSAFFFVNLFAHIGLPLFMGIMLWTHVSRVARPMLLPPKKLTYAITGSLIVLSLFVPAVLGPAADPFQIQSSTPLNLPAAWWLPLTERLSPGGAWALMLGLGLALISVPRFTRRKREGALAPSVVDPRLCTGCNQCPQDCPWEAITMVERSDGRPTLLAQVDALRCVSCGICAGSCAPMGIGPPGRSGREQLVVAREDILPAVSATGNAVVAVCCAKAPVSHMNAISARGAQIHTVPCAGNLHSSVVEILLRGGAQGVVVFHCPPRDCVGREGPKWLNERFYNDREAELQERVDRRRVRIGQMAPGEMSSAVRAYDSFVDSLRQISPPADPGAEPEFICDPVEPVEEEAVKA